MVMDAEPAALVLAAVVAAASVSCFSSGRLIEEVLPIIPELPPSASIRVLKGFCPSSFPALMSNPNRSINSGLSWLSDIVIVEKGFLSKDNLKLLIVDDQIDTLLEKMRNFKAPQKPKLLTNE